MTLDEAIKHCLDIADGQDKCAYISVSEHAKERIRECANDHRQLAEWLQELKHSRELLGKALSDLRLGKSCETCAYNGCATWCEVKNCEYEWRYIGEVGETQ